MLTACIVMLVVGCILGLILSIASNVFKVEVDEREAQVTSMLPGYNCGGCGYPGCSGMAHALVSKELDTFACRPTKPDQQAKILEYLASTPGSDGETITVKPLK